MRVRAQFARQAPPAKAWWVLCSVLLLVSVMCAVLAWKSHQRTKALAAEAEVTRAAAIAEQAKTLRSTVAAPAPPYEASARELMALHAVPWPVLLAALESADVPGVRVTLMEYEATRSSARVEVAFVPPASPLSLLEQLNVGVPEAGSAWRWSLIEIDQKTPGAAGRAVLRANFSTAAR